MISRRSTESISELNCTPFAFLKPEVFFFFATTFFYPWLKRRSYKTDMDVFILPFREHRAWRFYGICFDWLLIAKALEHFTFIVKIESIFQEFIKVFGLFLFACFDVKYCIVVYFFLLASNVFIIISLCQIHGSI